ncbi:hypothetical protein RRG08_050263 [Elysia crispata]|uniref:Uncharacterized protein n=1 Tax=Elysia crispata TaxID=231223 RepID=A0AAE1E933_9GAST|nr:hypothetical protein RRG08_050263 [Elysia crispata]
MVSRSDATYFSKPDNACLGKDTSKPRKIWSRTKKKARLVRRINLEDVLKGQVITDVRNALDVTEAIKNRLALWPKGDEIVALLMLLKSDQMCTSFHPSAVTSDPFNASRESSGRFL